MTQPKNPLLNLQQAILDNALVGIAYLENRIRSESVSPLVHQSPANRWPMRCFNSSKTASGERSPSRISKP